MFEASATHVNHPLFKHDHEDSGGPGMIFEGKYELKTPRERLWEFINDPAKISKCLPDLKSLNVESAEKFLATIPVGVGFIKADFKFKIEIIDKQPISSVRVKAVGTGSGSSITIDTLIELNEIPEGSELKYTSETKVGGMIASLGQRLIRDAAEKIIVGVFTCVKQQVE
jgi:carbon monoxide dehydrogenase subunit G